MSLTLLRKCTIRLHDYVEIASAYFGWDANITIVGMSIFTIFGAKRSHEEIIQRNRVSAARLSEFMPLLQATPCCCILFTVEMKPPIASMPRLAPSITNPTV